LLFNSKELKKINIPTTDTDLSTVSLKTKVIDNRLINQDISLLFIDDIKDYFLGAKKMFEITLLEPLINFNPLQTIRFTYNYEQVIDIDSYTKSFVISQENGTTKITLQEMINE